MASSSAPPSSSVDFSALSASFYALVDSYIPQDFGVSGPSASGSQNGPGPASLLGGTSREMDAAVEKMKEAKRAKERERFRKIAGTSTSRTVNSASSTQPSVGPSSIPHAAGAAKRELNGSTTSASNTPGHLRNTLAADSGDESAEEESRTRSVGKKQKVGLGYFDVRTKADKKKQTKIGATNQSTSSSSNTHPHVKEAIKTADETLPLDKRKASVSDDRKNATLLEKSTGASQPSTESTTSAPAVPEAQAQEVATEGRTKNQRKKLRKKEKKKLEHEKSGTTVQAHEMP